MQSCFVLSGARLASCSITAQCLLVHGTDMHTLQNGPTTGPEIYAGVHLKNGRTVEADLVVDASGKQSSVSKWLEQLGHTPPDTISVASGLRYTYRMYEMTNDPQRDWTIAVCMDHPEYNRTAVVIPIETNKWLVSLRCSDHTTP